MPGRSLSGANGYRYGFNGKENDNEVKGIEGSQQDYGMRIYDPRLGRFLSVDPITKQYPELTPYQFASNTPIQAIDIDGLEKIIVVDKKKFGLRMAIWLLNGTQIWRQFQKDIKDPTINPEKRNVYIMEFKEVNSLQTEHIKFDKEGFVDNSDKSGITEGITKTLNKESAFTYGLENEISGDTKAELILINADFSSFVHKNFFKNLRVAIQAMKVQSLTIYHEANAHVLDNMEGDKSSTIDDHQKFYGKGFKLEGNTSPNYKDVNTIGDSPASTAKRQIESSGNKIQRFIEKMRSNKK